MKVGDLVVYRENTSWLGVIVSVYPKAPPFDLSMDVYWLLVKETHSHDEIMLKPLL